MCIRDRSPAPTPPYTRLLVYNWLSTLRFKIEKNAVMCTLSLCVIWCVVLILVDFPLFGWEMCLRETVVHIETRLHVCNIYRKSVWIDVDKSFMRYSCLKSTIARTYILIVLLNSHANYENNKRLQKFLFKMLLRKHFYLSLWKIHKCEAS